MAEVELKLGAKLNLLNQHELDESLGRFMQPTGALRATDGIRLPIVSKAGSNPFTMGGDIGTLIQGPDSGYVWSLRHLVIEGMATGDVINVLSRNRILWQLTAATFFARWGRGEIILRGGETLAYASVGAFTSTATIIAHGHAEQVPQELEGRFYVGGG